MLIGERPRDGVVNPEIPATGRIKQVWSSLSMESMRVKPAGTRDLDKLELASDDPLRAGSAQ